MPCGRLFFGAARWQFVLRWMCERRGVVSGNALLDSFRGGVSVPWGGTVHLAVRLAAGMRAEGGVVSGNALLDSFHGGVSVPWGGTVHLAVRLAAGMRAEGGVVSGNALLDSFRGGGCVLWGGTVHWQFVLRQACSRSGARFTEKIRMRLSRRGGCRPDAQPDALETVRRLWSVVAVVAPYEACGGHAVSMCSQRRRPFCTVVPTRSVSVQVFVGPLRVLVKVGIATVFPCRSGGVL